MQSGSRLALFTVCLLLLSPLMVTAGPFPQTVEYEGLVVNAEGEPLSGTFPATLRYFDKAGSVLFEERFETLEVLAGSFSVRLGAGAVVGHAHASLEALFAAHPQVELEFTLGGTTYGPRVGLLPAGHSAKSRLIASGMRQEEDEGPHWKGYENRSAVTAVQATQLAPIAAQRALASATEENIWKRPFVLPVRGPMRSRAVREIPVNTERREMPAPAQEINPPRHEVLFDANGNRFGTIAPKVDDFAAPVVPGGLTSAELLFEFQGIGTNGFLPPDSDGTVGPDHYVQMVNVQTAIYDKAGNTLAGPFDTNEIWAGFGGPCQILNNGDAIALYDEQADRYVLSQFAVNLGAESICFAISETPDPLGSYYLYELMYPTFPDYYKVGIWPNGSNSAYFMSTNSGFPGGYTVSAVDRNRMLIGAPTRGQYFYGLPNMLMPADVDGPTPPPTDSPGIFYSFRDEGEPYFGIPTPDADSIDIFEADVDFSNPDNSTFELVQEITPADGLDEFNWTVCGFFVSNCIPQPDTLVGIDSASWWPMQRLVYRNFGSHESLLGAWTVEIVEDSDRAAPRWFELRRGGLEGFGWSIEQQGTHAPDMIHRWMPSIGMDGRGNIALGYSRGDNENFPSIYYATRLATDPLGSLREEAVLFEGSGSQLSTFYRWGDYTSMELDPSDDCTFWYQNEYLPVTSGSLWRTRIGVFRNPGCLDDTGEIFTDGFESGDTSAWSEVTQ